MQPFDSTCISVDVIIYHFESLEVSKIYLTVVLNEKMIDVLLIDNLILKTNLVNVSI